MILTYFPMNFPAFDFFWIFYLIIFFFFLELFSIYEAHNRSFISEIFLHSLNFTFVPFQIQHPTPESNFYITD